MPRGRTDFLILALDIGSSSTRSAIFDSRAHPLVKTAAAREYSIRYTPDGGAELSPIVLHRAVAQCVRATFNAQRRLARTKRRPVAAIAPSSFWHGLLGLDRNWKPLTPIYTWADSRAAAAADRLRESVSEREVHARTGCMLHASFWPAKLTWLRQTRPGLFRRVALWVSPVDWILHELFGTTVSSVSMASATGLYDSARGRWDKNLCAICRVDPAQLPVLRVSTETSQPGVAGAAPSITTVFAAMGDGAAGNLGSGADQAGTVAINIGTSAAVRMVRARRRGAGNEVPLGLFRYGVDGERCVIGGAVSNAGNLRQWALRELRLSDDAPTNHLVFARAAAANDQLIALPFWAGERAPTWPGHQLGVLDGLNQATRAVDILRVLTCSVFYRLAQILELIETMGPEAKRVIVSGGILHSRAAVRLLADAIGYDVEMARARESSLRGAAVYGLQQLGLTPPRLTAGVKIKHDRGLFAKHCARRARQLELENLLRERVSQSL